MDLQNRSGQQLTTAAPAATGRASGKRARGKGLRIVSGILLIATALLAVGVVLLLARGGPKSESSFVAKDKFQAVFLNGGQVYFGKVRDLNKQYLTLDNIYYLRVNEQVQPDANAGENAQQDISLAKLGCELHGPEDKMVVNREQITFWENLKDDGQVAKAIAEFVKQNPDGQKCATAES